MTKASAITYLFFHYVQAHFMDSVCARELIPPLMLTGLPVTSFHDRQQPPTPRRAP